MRAPFNTTATIYDGPGTATPGFPRLVNFACRLVPDDYFKDFTAPLSESISYLTMEADEPHASANTPTGPGVWTFDFSKADRVVIALFPDITWVVVRVELCTWPSPSSPYWRAHLAVEEPPPIACTSTYLDVYYLYDTVANTWTTLNRTSPTTWVGGSWTLEAEITAAEPPGCESQWRATNETCARLFLYDGEGTAYAGTPGDPCYLVEIHSVAP